MNLFATVLTHPAPTANYRGESELNRTVIQKIADGRHEYPIVSPESMRNALREILAARGLPSNRERLQPAAGEGDEKQQLAVRYRDYPDPSKYIDDFLFGYLLAVKGEEMKKIGKARGKDFPLKRDSLLRMNLAKGLEPYRHVTVFTQSPMFAKDNAWKVGGEGGTNSALLHRETADTAFQYPFALNGRDFAPQPDWCRALVLALGDLAGVAGNHARSLYFMSPASICVRLTERLAPGYEQYHFTVRRDPATNERQYGSRLLDRLLSDECALPREEFSLGGEIVESLSAKGRGMLADAGVTLDADPARLLATVADRMLAAR